MRHRYACLVVPSFPVSALRRSRPELGRHPFAVVVGRAPGLIVLDACASARRAGVRPAMTGAEAQARVPGLALIPRHPACEASAQAALLDLALGVSPRVEDGGAGVVCLDLTGLGRLCPDEFRLADDLAACAEDAGLPVSVAIASTRTAARLAASIRPRTVIPPGTEADALASLPLQLLVASGDLRAVLVRWGLRTLSELAALPDTALIERLGMEGRILQRRARGEDLDPFVPYQPPAMVQEVMDLEWPIDNLEPFAFVLHGVLDRLVARVTARGWALGAVHVELGLINGACHAIPVSLAAPLSDSRAIHPLLMHAIRSSPPSAAIERVSARAEPAAQRMAQAALFSALLVSPEQLAATLARVEALVGRECVGSPALVDSHRPDAFVMTCFESASSRHRAPQPNGAHAEGARTPVLRRSRPPAAVDVRTGSDGAPREILGGPWKSTIRVASGPWRSCGEWWGETAWRREEWDAETMAGVIRLAFDRVTQQWWVEGTYD